MNPQAQKLNEIIQKENPVILSLLSKKGKNIFFPKKGILGQSADAKGKKINATIGTAIEDDGTPMRLSAIAGNITLPPAQVFPYAPSFGKPEIRKKWKDLLFEKNPALEGKKISLPVVTNALTHGLSMIGYLFVNEGDEIILSDYFWGNYKLIFQEAYGATLKTFTTFQDGKLNLNGLKETLVQSKNKKKIVLLNFPNNPTGYTPTQDEVKNIVQILLDEANAGSELIILIDDAYFGLVYEDGIETNSIFSYLANIHPNILAVKLDGATKEDYVWGFRVGFITFGNALGSDALYDVLEQKTAGAIRGNISNAPHISQSLLLAAYKSKNYVKEKQQKYEILKKRYQAVKIALQEKKYSEYFEPLPFNSGYFMCVQLKKSLDGETIRHILLDTYDTGVIHLEGLFRIAFSGVKENDIKTLFDNIYEACKKFDQQSNH